MNKEYYKEYYDECERRLAVYWAIADLCEKLAPIWGAKNPRLVAVRICRRLWHEPKA